MHSRFVHANDTPRSCDSAVRPPAPSLEADWAILSVNSLKQLSERQASVIFGPVECNPSGAGRDSGLLIEFGEVLLEHGNLT